MAYVDTFRVAVRRQAAVMAMYRPGDDEYSVEDADHRRNERLAVIWPMAHAEIDNDKVLGELIFHFIVDGPEGTRRQQHTRRDVLTGGVFLCGGRDLKQSTFEHELRGRDINVAVAHITIASTKSLPLLLYAALLDWKIDDLLEYATGNVSSNAIERIQKGLSRPTPVAMYSFNTKWACVLQYICVAPRWRGMGLGRRLYAHYERHVEQRPYVCQDIYLAAVPDAMDFYTRIGFRVTDTSDERTYQVQKEDDVSKLLMIRTRDGRKLEIKVYAETTLMVRETNDPDTADEMSDDNDDDNRRVVSYAEPIDVDSY